MNENGRFDDAMRPDLVAQASTGYSSKPSGAVRRVPLLDGDTRLGWVWSNGVDAAGWQPDDPTPASARAGAFVWRVLQAAHDRGDRADVVLEPRWYEPLYVLGDVS